MQAKEVQKQGALALASALRMACPVAFCNELMLGQCHVEKMCYPFIHIYFAFFLLEMARHNQGGEISPEHKAPKQH